MSGNDVSFLKEQLNMVLACLKGDPISNDGGIVKRIENLETKIETIDKRSQKTSWTVGMLYVSAGFILCAIFTLIIQKK